MNNSEKTYVLVNGAWHGAWSFETTKKTMQQTGARVISFDLPGHGSDKTEIKDVTLSSYVQKVKNEILKLDGSVILVGQSFAGFIISQVVEEIPDKVDKLIFIGAMIPYDEKSVYDIIHDDKESQLLQNLIFAEDKTWATVNEETLRNVVYNGASQDQIAEAAPKLVRQATEPFFANVSTTETRFGKLDKTFILCEKDKILSPAAQKNLVQTIGITETISLNTGHVPQVESPEELAELIINA